MNAIAFELLVLLILSVINGVFSMAEIALVSARRARLRQVAETSDPRGVAALELASSPNRFLATVQVGITLIGIVAGAYGGAGLTDHLSRWIAQVTPLAPYAKTIGFGIVVAGITVLTLVIGELVPKRVGLAHPEAVALATARPMRLLSRLAGPFVTFLSAATDATLRLVGFRGGERETISEDEVKSLVNEGIRAGVFLPMESAMVESVLELDRLPVRELMTPRAKIIWVHVGETHEAIWHKVVVSGHSVFPVYEGNRDHVVGMLSLKSLYAHLAANIPIKVRDLLTQPLVVPDRLMASALLDTFKKSGRHQALVSDEFGHVIGLVTLHDVMEAVLGDFPSQDQRRRPEAKPRPDGSWLVDAMMPCEEFERAVPAFRLDPPGRRDYQTFGGFLIRHLGRVPEEGDFFQLQGFRIEIIDMDGHRIDKVLLMPEGPAPAHPG
jgi:putative hemolysin